jgi:hypothetical protein
MKAAKLEIAVESQEPGARRKEEERRKKHEGGRKKEEARRSQKKCFYKYEMLPQTVSQAQATNRIRVISALLCSAQTTFFD